MDLIALLREFGAEETLIELAERWSASTPGDGDNAVRVWPEGSTPLTDDELSALLDGLTALGQNDEVGLGLIEAAADVATDARAEVAAREADAVAEAEAIEQARQRLNGEPEASGEGGDETPPEGGEGEGDEGAGEGGDGGEGDEGAGEGEGAGTPAESVTASARASRAALARRQHRSTQPPVRVEGDNVPAEIVFAGDVPGVSMGQRATDRHQLDAAIARRADGIRRAGGFKRGGEASHYHVATIHGHYPPERRLIDDDGAPLAPTVAGRRVEAVLRQHATVEAIVAAGGLCAPLTPYYGVETLGDGRRPLRDEALVTFQAARGGIISMAPPVLTSLAGAIDVWTLERDEAALDNTGTQGDPGENDEYKAILRVECGTERTSRIHAVVTRLKMGNILARTYGEWVQAWTDLATIAHARIAEQRLWTLMLALPNVANLGNKTTEVSAARDLVNYFGRMAATYRSRHRVSRSDIAFRVVMSDVVLDILAEDASKTLPGGGNALTNLRIAIETEITAALRERGVNITFSPDIWVASGQGSTALQAYPPSLDFMFYPVGSILGLDAGELDLGVVRDPANNAVNDFETFTETFEGVHQLGHQAFRGTLNLCPSGAVMGTLDPAGRCATYT